MMMPTMVTWVFAPEWLTPAEAAALMGPVYSEASILALIELGAVDVKDTDRGGCLVEKRSLWEYAEALGEVVNDGCQ